VQIVEIDARSLQQIDKWPWPRAIHAAIVDRLVAAGARSISFDVDFSALSNPKDDGLLAASLARANGIVSLPTFRQYADGGAEASSVVDSLPAPIFRDNVFVSAVNMQPDDDGLVRQMPLAVETAGVTRPSLAALAAETTAQTERGFDIDYAIDPATIPRHSVVDLIAGKVPASSLKGKRIIVGATAIEIGDRYAVPRYGVIPGVVIQALAAETLVQGGIPTTFLRSSTLAFALLLVLLVARARRRRTRVLLLGGGGAALLALPLVTETWFALTIPSGAAMIALSTATLAGGASLAFERFLARAFDDQATGLPNLEALANEKPAAGSAIVVARIQRFASIAAGLSPEATATLVQRVAERLRFDAPGRRIYRVDAADLAWIEAPDEAESLPSRLEGIALLMRAPVECGRLVDVPLTFGIAAASAREARQAVANAALAASQAEEDGTLLRHFEALDGQQIDWHLSLLGELDAAMAKGELWNAYQPKLDLATGRIVAAEALIRWSHGQRGPIRPDHFIPVVERAGRIRDLTLHVLEQALDDAHAWDRSGYPLGVAVNVSATLLADHGFIESVGDLLRNHKLPEGRVTIEVTETATMNDPKQAVAALNSWRALGVLVSIDDYGTGQSSLGYLQALPADELKIDMSFVRNIASDRRNAIMVRSTIALAHELGMKVVAEGVEDEVCLQMLKAMGCDIAQGYHIGRPDESRVLLERLRSNDRAAA
jgi:EAL domain-containing protein (putative c-di-GMP-specific phosphodiesterase class I)/CHASE2 domain-containing sensor protein